MANTALVVHPSSVKIGGEIEGTIWTVWWVWQDSSAKTGNVLHGIQTGLGLGVIMLQEKGGLLLWPSP